MFGNLFSKCSTYLSNTQYGMIVRFRQLIKENEWDFLTDGTGDNGAFSELTETVEETGASFNGMMQSIGISLAGAAIITLAIGLLFGGKNGTKREEKKEQIPYTFLGVCFIVGFAVVFVIAKILMDGIEGSLK